jgi:hypothetical protein
VVVVDVHKERVAELVSLVEFTDEVYVWVDNMRGKETGLFPCEPDEVLARTGRLVRILSLVLPPLDGNP